MYIQVFMALISFAVCLLILPHWIQMAKTRGFSGKDMHKKDQREVAEMGGIVVVFSIVSAVLVCIALDTFYYHNLESMRDILAVVACILIATIIGMTDDILGWRIGLSHKEKVLLTFFIPIPLVVVNAGQSIMTFPFLGTQDIGLLYPLLIVPIAIIGASNSFNMLAGYNGLEAGMGVVILSTLGFLAYLTGETTAAVIAGTTVAALLAFLLYNKYPARVFPGDTMTYPIGAIIGMVAIIGNIERFAATIYILYYIELILKARGKLKAQSFAKLLEDGSLAVREKVYSIPHVAILFIKQIKGRVYENEVVLAVLIFQGFIALLTLYSYYALRD